MIFAKKTNVFTIKAGRHYCRPRRFRCAKEINALVYIDEKWKHDPAHDVGISKIIGLGSIRHHRNSLRLGWRCTRGDIFVYAYGYQNGERIIKPITRVVPGWHRVQIWHMDGAYHLRFAGLDVYSQQGPKPFQTLWPYFGGQKPAPHAMRFEIIFKDMGIPRIE